MKRVIPLLFTTLLTACADQKVVTNTPVIYPRDAWGDSTPADSVSNIREASHIHTYLVNDYIDPNDPRIRHQGHQIDVVEQDEKWNLRPSGTTVANLGPVTAVSDPASVPNPYTAEFETELTRERDQNQQMAAAAQEMSDEIGRLREMIQKGQATSTENDTLKHEVDALQKEIDSLKTPPPSKSGSWIDAVKGLFRKTPAASPPASAAAPSFHISVALREPESPVAFPAPGTALPPGLTIASAAPPKEVYRMSALDEAGLQIPGQVRPASGSGDDDFPPLPQK